MRKRMLRDMERKTPSPCLILDNACYGVIQLEHHCQPQPASTPIPFSNMLFYAYPVEQRRSPKLKLLFLWRKISVGQGGKVALPGSCPSPLFGVINVQGFPARVQQ